MQKFDCHPVLQIDHLVAYPCCLANSDKVLKQAIEFDKRPKENVGLTKNLEIVDFVKKNPKRDCGTTLKVGGGGGRREGGF